MKETHKGKIRLEPDYYKQFTCKCGNCRNCCCGGWQIRVSMNEYFSLIGMECSEELHRRLEIAFTVPDMPSPDCYRRIAPNYIGVCPMLGDDGLCMIQKECGESVLPEVCRLYPRSLASYGSRLRACCSGSCEATVELLLRDEPLSFVYRSSDGKSELINAVDLHSTEVGIHCAGIFRNRRLPLSTRIAGICRYVHGSGVPEIDASKLPYALDCLLDVIQELCNEARSLVPYTEKLLAMQEPQESRCERFCSDRTEFETNYPLWESYFENMLQNHLFYTGFPAVDSRIGSDSSVYGLCLAYAVMRASCIAYTRDNPTKEALVDAISGVFHLIEHTPFYYNARILIKDYISLLTI